MDKSKTLQVLEMIEKIAIGKEIITLDSVSHDTKKKKKRDGALVGMVMKDDDKGWIISLGGG